MLADGDSGRITRHGLALETHPLMPHRRGRGKRPLRTSQTARGSANPQVAALQRHRLPVPPASGRLPAGCLAGQTRADAGSPPRYLASDEETAGSIWLPVEGSTSQLGSHRLPNPMMVSDFGSRMGATMSAQVRLEAVIVAVGCRLLASPDIGFRSPLPGAQRVLSS